MTSTDGKDVYAVAHGLISAADISNGARGEIMYGIVRYSFTIVASFCVAVFTGERAFGQVLKSEAAFMTGFALSDSQVWVRPVGAAVSKNGSLIVTEGGHGTIWRVATHETAQGTHHADTGRDLYIANCSACHQASGEGLPSVMPPLKGSGVVNKDDAGKHIQVVLNGMQGARARGVVYAAVMPPFAGVLSDAEISDIINYERSSWGNHGTPVTPAQVAAERARPK
jgi:mono/diheme cytochrome c family protein